MRDIEPGPECKGCRLRASCLRGEGFTGFGFNLVTYSGCHGTGFAKLWFGGLCGTVHMGHSVTPRIPFNKPYSNPRYNPLQNLL